MAFATHKTVKEEERKGEEGNTIENATRILTPFSKTVFRRGLMSKCFSCIEAPHSAHFVIIFFQNFLMFSEELKNSCTDCFFAIVIRSVGHNVRAVIFKVIYQSSRRRRLLISEDIK